MIERIVVVRLQDEFQTDEARGEIAAYSQRVLETVPQVVGVRVAEALDENTRKDWDLLLAIRLSAAEDLEPFRTDPVHRDYVDNYLRPKIAKIKGWNFS